MNKYQILYMKIIDNARQRSISGSVYTENHHILPKSLGGDDSQSNLVKLTAREHFICHYLLCKFQTSDKSRIKMIQALNCMCKLHNNYHNRYTNSRLFEKYKLEYINHKRLTSKGLLNANADLAFHVYYNCNTHEYVKSTRYEMSCRDDLSQSALSDIHNGYVIHNWGLVTKTNNKPRRKNSYSFIIRQGKNSHRNDNNTYKFSHPEFGEVVSTRTELLELDKNLTRADLSGLIRQTQKSAKGWILLSSTSTRKLKSIQGINHPNADTNLYKFYHNYHGIRICDRYTLIAEFPELESSAITFMVRGTQKVHKGWRLELLTKERIEKGY